MLWLTGVTTVSWLVAMLLAALVMREEFDEAYDNSLEETAHRLLPLVVTDYYAQPEGGPVRIENSAADREELLVYQLRDTRGRVLLRSHDAPPEPFEAPLREGYSDTATHRVYTEPAVSGTLILQVGDPFAERREAVGESVTSLILPLLLLVPGSLAAVFLIVRRSLAPVAALRREIERRGGTDLAPLQAAELPRELKPIASSVDRLLKRLRVALQAEREFAANSAHELRTPIAGALAQAQRLVAEVPEARDRAVRIARSLANLARLAEKLVQLARAEAGIGMSGRLTDIVPVVRLVLEDAARDLQFPERLVLAENPVTRLERVVDVDALAIVLRNLVENALVHGARDGVVTVRLDPRGAVSVTNEGPVIEAHQLERLTERFRRGSTRAAGSGLGLSIAAAIAERMGGTLELFSPARGKETGFEAIVRLA